MIIVAMIDGTNYEVSSYLQTHEWAPAAKYSDGVPRWGQASVTLDGMAYMSGGWVDSSTYVRECSIILRLM